MREKSTAVHVRPAVSQSSSSRRLVAVILTRNEAAHIAGCIADVQRWVETVIVWDSGSTDATTHIARRAGALVVCRPFDHWARQRQAALDSIDSRWILFVDADERITPMLGHEIRSVIESEEHVGYWIPRRNFIVGHEMKAGGFVPDHQLRLLRRDSAHYDQSQEVHEVVELDGSEGYLSEPLIHHNYTSWQQFHRKQCIYARYEARILAQRGIQPRPHNFILQPLREFRRRYISLHGWRDGIRGLQVAVLLAWYYGFLPYWLLLEVDF